MDMVSESAIEKSLPVVHRAEKGQTASDLAYDFDCDTEESSDHLCEVTDEEEEEVPNESGSSEFDKWDKF